MFMVFKMVICDVFELIIVMLLKFDNFFVVWLVVLVRVVVGLKFILIGSFVLCYMVWWIWWL